MGHYTCNQKYQPNNNANWILTLSVLDLQQIDQENTLNSCISADNSPKYSFRKRTITMVHARRTYVVFPKPNPNWPVGQRGHLTQDRNSTISGQWNTIYKWQSLTRCSLGYRRNDPGSKEYTCMNPDELSWNPQIIHFNVLSHLRCISGDRGKFTDRTIKTSEQQWNIVFKAQRISTPLNTYLVSPSSTLKRPLAHRRHLFGGIFLRQHFSISVNSNLLTQLSLTLFCLRHR